MWIQDLFLDAFDGTQDLGWDHLRESLNGLHIASQDDADRLTVSLLEILGTPPTFSAGRLATVRRSGGSIIVRQGASSVDLCRLPGRESGQWESRQILPGSEESGEGMAALRAFSDYPADLAWTLISDLVPPLQRVAEWQQRGLWDRLAMRTTTSLEGPPTSLPTTPVPMLPVATPLAVPLQEPIAIESEEDAEAERVAEDPAAAMWRTIDTKFLQWRRELLARVRPATSHTDTSESLHRLAHEHRSAEETGRRQRAEYLEAKQQLAASWSERAQRLGSLEALQLEGEALDLAESVAEMWAESQRLLSEPEAETLVSEEDLTLLKKLDQQLVSVRRRLAQGRKAQEVQAVRQPIVTGPSAATLEMRHQLEQLLDRWQKCESYVELLDRSDGLPEVEEEESEDVIRLHREEGTEDDDLQVLRRLRSLSQRWRDARRELETTERWAASRSTFQADSEPLSDDHPQPTGKGRLEFSELDQRMLEERRESLQRQIRQLRDESRQLLARQLLSRPALFGIGILFSVGIAILLSAVTLDLRGAEMAAGAIGITCLLSAALLKASFERAPADELRRQRVKVHHLLRELHDLPVPWQEWLAADDPTTQNVDGLTHDSDQASSERGSVGWSQTQMLERLSQAQRLLEASYVEWQGYLAELELPLDASPTEALRMVQERRRSTRSRPPTLDRDHRRRPAARPQADAELIRARKWVDHWCQDAADWWNAQDARHERCPVDECTPRQWRDRLRQEQVYFDEADQLAQTRMAESAETSPARVELEELQRRLKQLKRRREKLCERLGVTEVAQLESRWEDQQRHAAARQEGQTMRRELLELLHESPHADTVERWLEESIDLAAHRENHRQRIHTLRTELAQLEARQQEWRERIQTLGSDRSSLLAAQSRTSDNHASQPRSFFSLEPWKVDLIQGILATIRAEHARVWQETTAQEAAERAAERAARQAAAQAARRAAQEAAERRASALPVAVERAVSAASTNRPETIHSSRRDYLPLRPLLRATSWLRSVTGQRDLQLLLDPNGIAEPDGAFFGGGSSSSAPREADHGLTWMDGRQGARRWSELGESERHLVVLCLQMALAEELRTEMGGPPWILTDRSLQLPGPMVLRLLERLSELAAGGQQILLLTTQADVVAWCADRGLTPTRAETKAAERSMALFVPELPILEPELPLGPARPLLVSPGELAQLDESPAVYAEPEAGWERPSDRPAALPFPVASSAPPPVSVLPPVNLQPPASVMPSPVPPPLSSPLPIPPFLPASSLGTASGLERALEYQPEPEPNSRTAGARELLETLPPLAPLERKYEVTEVAWERAG